MKIIVCVKQVPDTSGKVAVNPNGTLNRASMQTVINPDDKNALEAALEIKETRDAHIVAVSMGPMAAIGMLHELLAMGADEAVLVSGREFGGSDTFATSQILAAAAHKIGIEKGDLVLCGRQAIDGDTAQVGPQMAEKLDIPQISYAAEITLEDDEVTVRQITDSGYALVKSPTPCLITCIKELNQPRYMTVKGVLHFDEKPVTIFDYEALKDEPLIETDTIGLKGSPTNIYQSFSPPQKGRCKLLEGSLSEVSEQVRDLLKSRHII